VLETTVRRKLLCERFLGALLVLFPPFYLSCSQPQAPKAVSDQAYEEALQALYDDQLDQAKAGFEKVLELAPDSLMAMVRLSEVNLRLGYRSQAKNILWELCSPGGSARPDSSGINPDRLALVQLPLPPDLQQRPEARILQARLIAFEGQPLTAWQRAEAVLQDHPQSVDARLLLAELALKASATMDLPKARDLSREVLLNLETHHDAGQMYIEAQLNLGQFAEAVSAGRTHLSAYPDDGYAALLVGTAAYWGEHEDATVLLAQAVDRNLQNYTERLKSQWLLKLAWQRKGGYPADLADRYRFELFGQDGATSLLRFVDIAPEAGVAKRDRGRGSAWLDFDGDGDLDLFSVGIQSVHGLYRNEGGHFEDVAAAQGLDDARGGWGALAADFDNDGDRDLFVTRDAWEGAMVNSLYRNEDGHFTDIAATVGMTQPQASFTAAWGDADLDGFLDLYVANGVVGQDGHNNLWYNQQGKGFQDKARQAGVADSSKTIGTAWGDYDSDGYPDLYAVNSGAPNRLYRNRGDGSFAERAHQAGVAFPLEGGYVTFFFDFNNDGQLDLFATTMSAFEDVLNSWVAGSAVEPNRPFLYLNNGDGSFADISLPAGLGRSFGSMGAGVGDVDNNGFADIYLANGGPEMYRFEPDALFLNQGDGSFSEVTVTAGLGNLGKGHGATFADYDADGDLDLYAGLGGHYNADVWPNSLYRNDGPVGNFIRLQLVGTTSNRDAIGARAIAYCEARQIHAQLSSGFGFGSSNGLVLHLGLGRVERVERVEIRWPNGARQSFKGLPINSTVQLVEGESGFGVVER